MIQKGTDTYLSLLAETLHGFISADKAKVLVVQKNDLDKTIPGGFFYTHAHELLETRGYTITEIILVENYERTIELLLEKSDKGHFIVFHNYEALGHFQNIWIKSKLYRFENVKIVITCDEKYLTKVKDSSVYFSPFFSERRQRDGLLSLFSLSSLSSQFSRTVAEIPLTGQDMTVDELVSHPLYKRSYSREEVSSQLWADSILRNDSLTRRLVEIYLRLIHLSRFNEAIGTMASNAFKILIMGNVNLSGYDFTKIFAPDADFIGGYFDSTLFRGARLPGVDLSLAWARDADFSEADLSGCHFGTLPHIKSQATVHAIILRADLDIIYTSDGNDIIAWRLSNLTKIKTYSGHSKKVLCLCLDADGSTLFSGAEDGYINIWSTSNDEFFKLEGHRGAVNTLSLNSHDSFLVSGGADGTVRLWEIKDKKEKARHPIVANFGVRSVSSSRNTYWIASTSSEAVFLWEPFEKKLIKLVGFKKNMASVDISDDGEVVLAGCIDGNIVLWNLMSQDRPIYFSGHKEFVSRVKLSKDLNSFMSASYDKSIRLWKIDTKSSLIINGHENRIHDADLSDDCRQIVSCSHDQTIRIWNVSSFQIKQSSGHQDLVKDIKFSPDGRFFSSASSDTLVKAWDINSGIEIASFSGGNAKVICLHINKGSTHICSGSDDGTIVVRNIRTGEQKIITEFTVHINSIYLNHMATKVYLGLWDNTIRVFDLETNELRIIGKHGDKVNSIDLSDDESLLVSGGVDKVVCVWNLKDLSLVQKLSGHTFIVIGVKITADGKYAVSAGIDRSVKVWDIDKKEEISSLGGHNSIIWCIDLSKDGKYAATGSADKTIRIWDIQQGKLLYLIDLINTPMGISIQHDKLVVGYDDGTIHLWKKNTQFDDKWVLHWSSKVSNSVLHLAKCRFFNTIGLSSMDRRLISQKEGLLENSTELIL